MHRVLIVSYFCVFLTVTAVPSKEDTLSAHAVGKSLAKCIGEPNIFQCFQKEAVNKLDILLRDNSTWQYGDFIQFEKDQYFKVSNKSGQIVDGDGNGDSPGDVIAEKLLQLAQSRSIRMKMNPELLEARDIGEGGDTEARKKKKIWYLHNSLKGRKKKDKKGMAMMGSLAMIAMVGQMFLGKVMLIAGAAFLMSKIALLLSILTSLKSKVSGTSTTDHVVTIDSGGGHSDGGHSAWHRSLPYMKPSPPIHIPHEEHHEIPQLSEYYPHDLSSQKDDYKFI